MILYKLSEATINGLIFTTDVFSIFNTFLRNSGKVTEGHNAMVVLIDVNEKELASPKALGGYKIKR